MPVAERFRASLDRLVAHTDRDVRLQAARCVGHLPGMAGINRMRELCDDPDAEVRLEALQALARQAAPAGRSTLRNAFAEDTDLRCRRAALHGLVALEDRSIVPALRRLVRNPDAFIYEQSPQTQAHRQALCCEAVEALGLLGDASVVDDLLGLLQRHVAPILDDAVIRALSRLGDAGREALAGLTQESTADRARRAVEALADHAEADQVEALGIFLGHPDGSVRLAAAQALVRLVPCHSALLRRANDPEPAVRALIARHTGPTMPSTLALMLDDPAPAVVAAALAAVGEMPAAARTPDIVLRVRCKLRHPAPEVACTAAATLATIDPEAALPELAARLADPDAPAAVRIAAGRTLATLATPAAFARLAQHVVEAGAEVRTGVLNALAGLAASASEAPIRAFMLELLTRPSPEATPQPGLAEPPAGFVDASGRPELADAATAIRAQLAELLADWPSDAVEAALVPLTEGDEPVELRLAGALALAQTVERLGRTSAATRDAARRLLAADDPRLRLAAVRMLTVAAGEDEMERLQPCLDDPDPSVRALALRWFGETEAALSPGVMDRLQRGLEDANAGVRLAAMGAILGRRGTKALGPVIEAILRHGDESIPLAARLLARLPVDRVHDELARGLATACNRKRQLALLRLSDALLMAEAPNAA